MRTSVDRDLVILTGAGQTKNPQQAFRRFIDFAEDGGVYIKLGRGVPKHAPPGCNAFVVFDNKIVGVLQYDGVDESFVPGDTLDGYDDDYVMEEGPALRFVGPYRELKLPIQYRKGFRSWEYLPEALRDEVRGK